MSSSQPLELQIEKVTEEESNERGSAIFNLEAIEPRHYEYDSPRHKGRPRRTVSADVAPKQSEATPDAQRSKRQRIAKIVTSPYISPSSSKRTPSRSSLEERQSLSSQSPSTRRSSSSSSLSSTPKRRPSSPTPLLSPSSIENPSQPRCSECNRSHASPLNELFKCDRCLRSFHQLCLEPPADERNRQRDLKWFCDGCLAQIQLRRHELRGKSKEQLIGLLVSLQERHPLISLSKVCPLVPKHPALTFTIIKSGEGAGREKGKEEGKRVAEGAERLASGFTRVEEVVLAAFSEPGLSIGALREEIIFFAKESYGVKNQGDVLVAIRALCQQGVLVDFKDYLKKVR